MPASCRRIRQRLDVENRRGVSVCVAEPPPFPVPGFACVVLLDGEDVPDGADDQVHMLKEVPHGYAE